MRGLAGLVLAAGASTRMGTPKQLLPIARTTLLDRVLSEALASDLGAVVLVLGHRAADIRKGLQTDLRHAKLKVVDNDAYHRGMSSSIVAGLAAVEKDWDGVMIILGDMPCVSAQLINLLIRQSEECRRPLAAISSGGRRSHPVVIGRPFFPALHRLRGDEGARALFVAHPDQVCLVEPHAGFDDRDIDTPDDYQALRKTLESS